MRLIDADKLPNYDCLANAKVGEMSGPVKWRFVFWEDVEKAPTVDAVTVVRCRDCGYAFLDRWHKSKEERPPVWRCRKFGRLTVPDGFCHKGKIREEDENEAD